MQCAIPLHAHDAKGLGLLGISILLLLQQLLAEYGILGAPYEYKYLGAPYITCMRNTTSVSKTFTLNLDVALSNLTDVASQGTKYVISTSGSGQDKVYAMFQCRGDQSLQSCWECVREAAVRLPINECPASLGARIQLDGCYLRYDNRPFFELDTSVVIGYCYAPTTDPVALAAIADLMKHVTNVAPKQNGFASASASGEYAVAQCLGYLNESECSQCLSRYSYGTVCDETLGEQLHLTSCYYRYEPYSFYEAPSPSLPPPLPPPKAHGSKFLASKLGSAGAIIGVIILCAILAWRFNGIKLIGSMCASKEEDLPRQVLQKAQVFSLEQLEESTEHFHPKNKLGEGGFGIVYKGILSNKELVAIKKLSFQSKQGQKEFLNEVEVITSVQHKNLIRLVGCCVQSRERILVYEYLPNKSLDSFLFGVQNNDKTLNWSTRYAIILGMAKGLAYLHEESHIRIIHRDIKPSNILLDDQLNPVIADFGLARLVSNEDATIIHTRIAGTIGYLAPEYALRGDLSEKVDVFSFGIVTLEIVSGKRNLQSRLLAWMQVWELYLHEKIFDLVDEKIGNAFSSEQVIRVVHVALLCTQENPKQRPTMSMVNSWLFGMVDIVEMPNRPLFLSFDDEQQTHFVLAPSGSEEAVSISGGVQSVSEIREPR